MKNNLVFGIRSSLVPPYLSHTQECLNTWGKEAKDKGYNVKILLGDPNLQKEFIDDGDILWSKAIDNNLTECFQKTVFYPCKWFLENTLYEYFFITDCDTFIRIDKFVENLEFLLKEYKEIDYMGCCTPYRGWNPFHPTYEIITEPGFYASGGSGFLLSRKSAYILINTFLASDYNYDTKWDDLIVGDILFKHKVYLLHNGKHLFFSPFKRVVYPYYEPTPYIGDSTGNHLIVQHYVDGKMEQINDYLRNN